MDKKYQDIIIRNTRSCGSLFVKRKITIVQMIFTDENIKILYEEETPVGVFSNIITINKTDLLGKELVID